MPDYLVNVSGQIKVTAENKVEAEKLAKTYNSSGCYCGYHVREVGKDCDYLGWDLPKRPNNCECDNTHEQNNTCCQACWAKGFRSCK